MKIIKRVKVINLKRKIGFDSIYGPVEFDAICVVSEEDFDRHLNELFEAFFEGGN